MTEPGRLETCEVQFKAIKRSRAIFYGNETADLDDRTLAAFHTLRTKTTGQPAISRLVTMAGYWNINDGYGVSCSLLAQGLHKRNWDLRFKWIENKDSIMQSFPDLKYKAELKEPGDGEVVLAFCMTPSLAMIPQGFKKLILYFFWESTDYPKTWGTLLKFCDLILTPSDFCTDVAKRAGAKCPIFNVGLPIGIDNYPYLANRSIQGKFKVLFVSSAYERKGFDLVIKSFLEAFPNANEAELHMHVPNLSTNHWLIAEGKKHSNVIVTRGFLPQHAITAMYHRAHCLVHPARGEGYGRTPSEAMLTGLPVISTSVTGLADFVSQKTAYVIETSGWKPCNHPFYTTGMWAEPVVGSIVSGLRWTKENYPAALERAYAGRQLILEKNGNDACVSKVDYILQNTYRLGFGTDFVTDYEKSFGSNAVYKGDTCVEGYFND